MNINFNPVLLVIFAGILTAAGNIFLKLSRLSSPQLTIIEGIFHPYFILGLFFYSLNVLVFVTALDKLSLTIAYPVLTGIGFLLVTFFSIIYLNESLSLIKFFGALLILIGIYLIA